MMMIKKFLCILFIQLILLELVSGFECKTHDTCNGFLSLNTYCCEENCCNWFVFLYKSNKGDISSSIEYKGASLLTIAFIALIVLALCIVLCCICCVVCTFNLCNQCCKTKKVPQTIFIDPNIYRNNGPQHINRTEITFNSPLLNNMQSQPQPQQQQQQPFYVTQNQINRVLPSQPPLHLIQPSAPCEEPLLTPVDSETDKPPTYDDLVKSGDVTISDEKRKC